MWNFLFTTDKRAKPNITDVTGPFDPAAVYQRSRLKISVHQACNTDHRETNIWMRFVNNIASFLHSNPRCVNPHTVNRKDIQFAFCQISFFYDTKANFWNRENYALHHSFVLCFTEWFSLSDITFMVSQTNLLTIACLKWNNSNKTCLGLR